MKIEIDRRSAGAYMGRFGGGWNWKLGLQASTGFRTVIISLLTFSIIFRFNQK